ncbi:MAG: hypothetical protein GY860_00780 [Desulfobacteraceae bacterium]|nr:hypothetical protein [Desulfobacteraceae bacterium]
MPILRQKTIFYQHCQQNISEAPWNNKGFPKFIANFGAGFIKKLEREDKLGMDKMQKKIAAAKISKGF